MKLLTNGKFRAILAMVTVVAILGYAFAVSFIEIPESSRDFVHFILGVLIGGVLKDVFGFYYGSSDKTEPETDNSKQPQKP